MYRAAGVFLCALLHCALALGQSTPAPGAGADPASIQPIEPDSTTYRLRTYVNRIQIPTMVLGYEGMPVPDLLSGTFVIRLDFGPAFHPTRTRVEDDDPISLGVLIDNTGAQPETVAKLADALSNLGPDILSQTDSLSIFSADCKMYRTRLNRRYDPSDAREAVLQALRATQPQPGSMPGSCAASFHLLDYVSYMLAEMKNLPGRRVALIVSGGHEKDSHMKLPAVTELAAREAVAIFGLRDKAERGKESTSENLFDLLCTSNGGMIFEPTEGDVQIELERLLYFIHKRYILEFPAPDHGASGVHSIEVRVGEKNKYLVRTTGASAFSLEKGAKPDPNVIPTQASPAVFGSRRPLDSTKR